MRRGKIGFNCADQLAAVMAAMFLCEKWLTKSELETLGLLAL